MQDIGISVILSSGSSRTNCISLFIGTNCWSVAFASRFAIVNIVEGDEPSGFNATSILRLTLLLSAKISGFIAKKTYRVPISGPPRLCLAHSWY